MWRKKGGGGEGEEVAVRAADRLMQKGSAVMTAVILLVVQAKSAQPST